MGRHCRPLLITSLLAAVIMVSSCTVPPVTQAPPVPSTSAPADTSTPTPTPTLASTQTPTPTSTPTPAPTLSPTTKPSPTTITPSPAKLELSQVKVACLYSRVTDGTDSAMNMKRIIKQLKETKTDYIHMGFHKWSPCPEKYSQFQQPGMMQWAEHLGYSYEVLEKAVGKIKEELPRVIFCGSLAAEIIGEEPERCEWNAKTGERIEQAELWKMATDPGKWGINMSKERFQHAIAKWAQWVPKDLDYKLYDWQKADAFFPDITNTGYQELLVSWAQRQIDAGAEAIWIDLMFMQADLLGQITGNGNHAAVKESCDAVSKIVDEIHKYGSLKGKRIYVGSWPMTIEWARVNLFGKLVPIDYPSSNFDFVTVSPYITEVKEMKFNEAKWDKELADTRQKYGNIPVLAKIDWSFTSNTPLGVLSQKLSSEEQNEFLRIADDFFARKGVIFAYPIWGGSLGSDATILASGKYNVYDSQAPEFRTYDTIKELARIKKLN